MQVIRNQGRFPPPLLAILQNWGGGGEGEFFFENYKFYMTHFGLIKLESSNLLDITIDALNMPKVRHIYIYLYKYICLKLGIFIYICKFGVYYWL